MMCFDISNSLRVWVMSAMSLALVGCATLPSDFEKTQSFAFAPPSEFIAGNRIQDQIDAQAGQSGYYLLSDGLDAFVARAVLARNATSSIDAQYYLYNNDLTGALFTREMIDAAQRGVRVRLLVDDIGVDDRVRIASVVDSHPNIEVRVFNPFSRAAPKSTQYVTRFGKVTRRMHNKTFTVDNQISILGGRNIGNEYFDATHELVFSDLDVMVVGPLVPEISQSFDLYWNHALAYPVTAFRKKPIDANVITESRGRMSELVSSEQAESYRMALRGSDLARRMRNGNVEFLWGDARVIYDHPQKLLESTDNEKYHLSPDLREYFKDVKKELVIISPYFVPGRAGTALLEELSNRGVRVRIITNSLAATDVAIVHAGYMRYRKRLLRAGVEIFEADKEGRALLRDSGGLRGSSKASLHTKSFIFDREVVFVGSLNLDPRSLKENTEIGLILDSVEVAREMTEWVDQFIRNEAFEVTLERDKEGYDHLRWTRTVAGETQTWKIEPHASFWLRLGVGLMQILPIESQL